MSKWNTYFCCRLLFSITLGLIPLTTQAASGGSGKPANPHGKNVEFPKRVFVFNDQWLKLEWDADSVLHFEFGRGTPPNANSNIYVSPLFANAELPGPQTFNASGRSFTTKEMKVDVSASGDCFDVTDIARGQRWTHICAPDYNPQLVGSVSKPSKLLGDWKVFPIQTYGVKDAYGLGQLFGDPNSMDLDRLGKVNDTHGDYGNMMTSYAGGATGETFFPVIYALGAGSSAFLFTMDNIYKQRWDLTNDLWRIGTFGDTIRGYVVVGANPLELRRRFMAMAGHMVLPPKKLFGYWMSEYGYEKWSQVDEKLEGMRADHFPIDGFFLDLQWFGNVKQASDYTAMGKLTFDESNFPDPAGHIAAYRKQGIGIIPIEESYVGKALNEYKVLGDKGYLAHDCGAPNKPSYLTGENTGNTSEWWGRGGMMDWSNPEGAAFWHDSKRQKLINLGIMGHWLDLGEPEMFDRTSCYHGAFENRVQHQDVHNLFSLLWAKSVAEGYARNKVVQRPFSMLRSGNIGMQHYSAGMWSGDIGGNTESLTAHHTSHSHLSWSGIDLYSSDIGGFHRNRANGQPLSDLETQETFTQWFANATWFDIPVRSHVMNLDKDRETAPNRIGHIESNRANLRQRYALTPYYYSLAWRAYTDGTPIFTPMAMAYPADLRFRKKGDQMLLGDILIGAAAERGVYFRDINLPAGSWYDLRDGTYRDVTSAQSSVVRGVPTYRNGLFQLPVYVREGALIPQNIVDEKTLGSDNRVSTRGEDAMKLSVFVANDSQNHEFVMYEDDGQTTAYQSGAVRYTKLSQKTVQHKTAITIDGAVGNFTGQSTRRGWMVNLHAPTAWGFSALKINGTAVTECKGNQQAESVCVRRPTVPGSKAEILIGLADVRRRIVIEAEFNAVAAVSASVHFVCQDSETAPRYNSMFIAGSDPKLGAWNLTKAIPMTTNNFLHGVWTAEISGLPPKTAIEWKCVKIPPQSSGRGVEWQPGNNNQFNTGDGGFLGISRGGFGRH